MRRPGLGGGWSTVSEPTTDDNIQRAVIEHNATRLVKAAGLDHDRALTQELLGAGGEPNRSDPQGRLPLHAAVCAGDIEITRMLLAAHADPGFQETTPDGGTPLQIAGWQGNDAIAKLLLEARADPNAPNAKGQTPLYSAAHMGKLATVQALLEARADANKATPVAAPVAAQAPSSPGSVSGWRQVTPLQAAIERRHTEVAKVLEKYGGRANPTHQRPSCFAGICQCLPICG